MNNKLSLTISSLGHFLVDFTCAYVVLSRLHEASSAAQILIIYNFMAFAMQMPFGIVADAYPDIKWSFIGVLCVLASLFPFPLLLSVLLIGTGNSLYHLGEGKPILDHMHGSSALGIFVAPGAFGITFGTLLKDKAMPYLIPIACALAVLAVLIWFRKYEGTADEAHPTSSFPLVTGLFIVVIIRSFAGFSWQIPWSAEHVVLMTCGVVLGKMLGGVLADAIGSKKAAFISLGISFLLFIQADWMPAGWLSVLFFNMTMPICLKQMTLELKNQSGFAFGLLTFALFLGYIPSTLGISTVSAPVTLFLIAVSIAMMGLVRNDRHD